MGNAPPQQQQQEQQQQGEQDSSSSFFSIPDVLASLFPPNNNNDDQKAGGGNEPALVSIDADQDQNPEQPIPDGDPRSTGASNKHKNVVADTPPVGCLGGSWWIGFRQVYALLTKIALTKMRTPLATSLEIITPVLLMLVLVAAFQLSTNEDETAQTYSRFEIAVPGPWLDLLTAYSILVTANQTINATDFLDNATDFVDNFNTTDFLGNTDDFLATAADTVTVQVATPEQPAVPSSSSSAQGRYLRRHQQGRPTIASSSLEGFGGASVFDDDDDIGWEPSDENHAISISTLEAWKSRLVQQMLWDVWHHNDDESSGATTYDESSSLFGWSSLSSHQNKWALPAARIATHHKRRRKQQHLQQQQQQQQQAAAATPVAPASVSWNDLVQTATLQQPMHNRALQLAAEPTDDLSTDDEFLTDLSEIEDTIDLLDQAYLQLRNFLVNPFGVPSLLQYVTASNTLTTLVNVSDLPEVFTDSSFGRQWGNLLTLGVLHLSPSSAEVVHEFNRYLNETEAGADVEVRIHESEAAALRYMEENLLQERAWALIDFSNWPAIDDALLASLLMQEDEMADEEASSPMLDVRYKIRLNYTTIPNTAEIIDFVSIGLNRDYQQYLLSGFLTLQRTVNEFALDYFLNQTDGLLEEDDDLFGNNSTQCTADEARTRLSQIWTMPMPTAAFTQNSFFLAVGYLLGLTIAMAYLYPTSRLIKSIVEEKESRMKESLFIMGVKPWAYWWSWFLSSLLTFFIIAFLVTATLSNNVLTHSDPSYLFAWIFFYSTSTMGFCFAIAALFSKAKLASIIGPLALFATLLPRYVFFGFNRYEAATQKRIVSLLPASAFAFGADIVADYEYGEQGIQDWNAGEGEYSFNTSLGFLVLDTFLYIGLSWYLEQVVPREYGSPRPVWFLVSPRYWLSLFVRPRSKTTGIDEEETKNKNEHSGDHEPVTDSSLTPGVRVRELVKIYNKGKTVVPAVNDLNLMLYESQITTLLGHNGAGKTTTISLLTGLFPPTSGDATVYGNSITADTDAARFSIGLCPQQNVLFERLTVQEHINFFQRIKGIRPNEEYSKEQAREVGIEEFYHVTAAALSGGNKRKLCVAVAICGNPKFLLFDEPTSGMDPSARRKTWEVLRRRRIGRTILLSTHYMDEAEILSDRVAVMKDGKLQCSGSPIFLKRRFGLGYMFTSVLEISGTSNERTDSEGATPVNSQLSIETASEQLLAFVTTHVPGTEIQRIGGKEVTLRLPIGQEDKFPKLFEALDNNRRQLSIGAFGIENASLEEVFIQLAEEEPGDDSHQEGQVESSGVVQIATGIVPSHDKGSANAKDQEVSEHPPERAPNQVEQEQLETFDGTSFPTQVGLLYWKRFVIQRRDPKGLFFLVVIPALVVGLVLLILTVSVTVAGPSIEMSPMIYDRSNTGEAARTDILVGGGSSTTPEDADEIYNDLVNFTGPFYEHVDFVKRNETNSDDLAQYLLESIDDRDRNERYGAFAVQDTLAVDIEIDWERLGEGIASLIEAASIFNGTIDLTNLTEDLLDLDDLGLTFAVNTSNLQELLNIANENFNLTMSLEMLQNQALESFDLILGNANVSQAEFQEQISTILNQTLGSEDFDVNQLLLTILVAAANGIDGVEIFSLDNVPDLIVNTTNGNGTFQLDILELLQAQLVESNFTFNATLVVEAYQDILTAAAGAQLPDQNEVIMLLVQNAADALTTTGIPGLELDDATIFTLVLALGLLANGNDPTAFLDLPSLDPFDVDLTVDGIAYDASTGILEIQGIQIFLPGDNIIDVDSIEFDIGAAVEIFQNLTSSQTTFSLGIDNEVSILHNASSPHAIGAYYQTYSDYLLKECLGISSMRFVSENHPLPLTTQQTLEIRVILSILAVLFILIPYCYIPGAFIVFIVRERSCKSKHLQLASGTSLVAYWVSTYLFDLTLFALLTVLVMIIFLIYGGNAAQVFVGDFESFLCTAALTFGYGLSVLPFSYLLARRFENHSSAQIAVIGLVFVTGFVMVNAYFIMDSIDRTESLAQALRPFFRFFPAYNVGDGLIAMASAFWEREVLGENVGPFDWEVAGKTLVILYSLSLPYFIGLLFFEFSRDGGAGGLIGWILRSMSEASEKLALKSAGVTNENGVLVLDDGLRDNNEKDSDVVKEEAYVRANSSTLQSSAPILIQDLWKIYLPSIGLFGSCIGSIKRFLRLCCRGIFCLWICGRKESNADHEERRRALQPKRAVRGMTTAVQKGEIYALLGANGAGKSTTLGILTGDISPTSGRLYVAGYDVTGSEDRNGITNARKHIGYCPQIDPLLDLMTVRETLTLYGRIRGISKEKIAEHVERSLKQLTLVPHADKTAQSLSGGNKRKLSLGIALIGQPSVLLIDESSSGLDPLAKRRMWNLISSVSKDKTVILTTHFMEEAEALCTRAGIMAKGQLLCLGSVQHLKTKYLDGYTIDIFCEPSSIADGSRERIDALIDGITRRILPGAVLAERHGRFLRFDFSGASTVGMGATFRHLEALKQSPDSIVENYSIAQCSLEQVFVQLLERVQEEPENGDETVAATQASSKAAKEDDKLGGLTLP